MGTIGAGGSPGIGPTSGARARGGNRVPGLALKASGCSDKDRHRPTRLSRKDRRGWRRSVAHVRGLGVHFGAQCTTTLAPAQRAVTPTHPAAPKRGPNMPVGCTSGAMGRIRRSCARRFVENDTDRRSPDDPLIVGPHTSRDSLAEQTRSPKDSARAAPLKLALGARGGRSPQIGRNRPHTCRSLEMGHARAAAMRRAGANVQRSGSQGRVGLGPGRLRTSKSGSAAPTASGGTQFSSKSKRRDATSGQQIAGDTMCSDLPPCFRTPDADHQRNCPQTLGPQTFPICKWLIGVKPPMKQLRKPSPDATTYSFGVRSSKGSHGLQLSTLGAHAFRLSPFRTAHR